MSRKSKIVLGAVLGSMALVALLCELSLRLAFGFGRPLLYETDSHVGYLPVANQDLRRFGAAIRINSFGMRSDGVPAPRRPASRRLLFIGDSVTFGTTYIGQSKIFTELIEASLTSKLHSPVEVLNASAGGWAVDNEYGYLVSRGTFDADLVVFVLNSGDLDQPFSAFEASPQFPTANPQTAIGELWTRYIEPRIDASIQTRDPGSALEKLPDTASARHVLQTLEFARLFASSRGAQFMIVFSPGLMTGLDATAWDRVLRDFRNWIDQKNVPLVDMTSVYARYPSTQFRLDAIHLNTFGHQLVAQEFVAHYLGASEGR